MKINIISDLHLDASNMSHNTEKFDIVILAGDIAVNDLLFEQFIERKIHPNSKILFVPGNHEFEGKNFQNTIEYYNNLEKIYENFNFLYNKSIYIENVKFIGSTLWSNFEGAGVNNKNAVKDLANRCFHDIKSIYETHNGKYKHWNSNRVEQEFNKCFDYLNFELKENTNPGYTKFVITHFAPSRKSLDKKFEHDIMSAYWVNNLSDSLLGFSDFWVHGHLHISHNYTENGTKVICNPRGYSMLFDMAENNSFNKNYCLELKPKPSKKNNP